MNITALFIIAIATLILLLVLAKVFGPKDGDPPGRLWLRKSER